MASRSQSSASPAPAAEAGGGSAWHRQVYEWLGNPLVIAVVSSLLVYWLIPQLTRDWQNHAKVLEVKTNLVANMSDSVGNAAMTGRFIASGLIGKATNDPNATQRAFNEAYEEWTVESAVIGSQLAAYFPGAHLGPRWRAYAGVVTDFVQLAARGRRDDRASQLLGIARYFPQLREHGKTWWRTLLNGYGGRAFQQRYLELSRAILDERDRFVQHVLDAEPTGF